MKIYLVNMDRSTDRLSIMKERLSNLGLTFERISAVDGYKLSQVEKEMVVAPNLRYPYNLTLGEVGCFLSHKKCWQEFLNSNEEWALILEDDSVFHLKAREYFQSTAWIPKECDLIQFNFTTDNTYSDKTIELPNGSHLVRVKYSSPCGTYAYLISKKAAKIALTLARKVEGPIDNFLFGMFFEFPKKIAFWRLQECVVRVTDDVAPTITGRGSKNKRMNLFKIHPARLMEKIRINRGRKKCRQVIQHWSE